MRKLLKFAVPILILALIFASCDDRGSTPSGGDLQTTVLIQLPERTDYPSTGYKVAFISQPSEEGAETEYALAGSVSYTPATKTDNAFLTVENIPAGNWGAGALVSYESSLGTLEVGKASLILSLGSKISGEVEEFSDATPAEINITLSAPEESAISLPDEASAYPLTLTGSAGELSYTIYPTSVKTTGATKALSKEAAPAKAELVYSASFEPVKGFTLPIGYDEESPEYTGYNGVISMQIGQAPAGKPNYTADVTALTLTPGTTPSQTPTLKEIVYGSVTVTLPETLDGEDTTEDNPAFNYTTVSYEVISSDEVYASGTATPKTAEDATTFAIENIATGGTYTLNVSLVGDNGNTWLAEDVGITAPTSATEAGSATVESFEEQIATLTVKLSGMDSYPANAKSYTVTYALCDKDGKITGEEISFSIPATALAQIGTTGFPIAGLAVGSFYSVSIEVNTGKATYSGTQASGAMEAGTSNEITVALEIISGTADAGDDEDAETATQAVTFASNSDVTLNGATEMTFSEGGSITLQASALTGDLAGSTGTITVSIEEANNKCSVSSSDFKITPTAAGKSPSALSWTSLTDKIDDFTVSTLTINGTYAEGTFTITDVTVTGSAD